MLQYNSLIINGRSTADLPFLCIVEQNAEPVAAVKKDILTELPMVNAEVKQSIDAWEPTDQTFNLYLHDTDKAGTRALKAFIGTHGTLISYDDPDVHYNFYKVTYEFTPLNQFNGYQVAVTFRCEPFAYEEERWLDLGTTYRNDATAPMWPRLVVYGQTSEREELTIGTQTMVFTEGINEYVTIECKHQYQDVQNRVKESINNQIRGPFFEIPSDSVVPVSWSSGITNVEMLERKGWL